MENLSHQDLSALLSAVSVLNSELDPATLPQRALSSLADLISSEIISFSVFDNDGTHSGIAWGNAPIMPTSEQMEIYQIYAHESPLFIESVLKKRTDVIKTTDFISIHEYRHTNIYNDFFRLIESDIHMAVTLPVSSDYVSACSLFRNKKDFSENDRARLTMIAPHLRAAIQNSQAFERLQNERALLQTAVEASTQSVIILNADGQIQFITDEAAKLLNKYFPNERPNAGFLPEELRRYAEHHQILSGSANEFFLPPPPFIAKDKDGELQARLSFNNQRRETTLLLEEKENLSPARFRALGLTKREAEVLFWITQGKTNIEIGILCGISWRTAQKHVENICKKLGAETRTAAAAFALEWLSRIH